ncbi:MAG: hypothetical protein WCV73_02945 [Patescibacteria group bacterium]|jgi:hypothetical protein
MNIDKSSEGNRELKKPTPFSIIKKIAHELPLTEDEEAIWKNRNESKPVVTPVVEAPKIPKSPEIDPKIQADAKSIIKNDLESIMAYSPLVCLNNSKRELTPRGVAVFKAYEFGEEEIQNGKAEDLLRDFKNRFKDPDQTIKEPINSVKVPEAPKTPENSIESELTFDEQKEKTLVDVVNEWSRIGDKKWGTLKKMLAEAGLDSDFYEMVNMEAILTNMSYRKYKFVKRSDGSFVGFERDNGNLVLVPFQAERFSSAGLAVLVQFADGLGGTEEVHTGFEQVRPGIFTPLGEGDLYRLEKSMYTKLLRKGSRPAPGSLYKRREKELVKPVGAQTEVNLKKTAPEITPLADVGQDAIVPESPPKDIEALPKVSETVDIEGKPLDWASLDRSSKKLPELAETGNEDKEESLDWGGLYKRPSRKLAEVKEIDPNEPVVSAEPKIKDSEVIDVEEIPVTKPIKPKEKVIDSAIQTRAQEMLKNFEAGVIPASINLSDEDVFRAYGIKEALIDTAKPKVLLEELKKRLQMESIVKTTVPDKLPESSKPIKAQDSSEPKKLSPEIAQFIVNDFAKFNISPEQLSSVEGFAELTPEQQAFLLENFKQIMLGRAQDQGKAEYKQELGQSNLAGKLWKNLFKQYYVAKTETAGAKKVFSADFEQHKKLLADLVKQTAQLEIAQDEKGRLEVGYLSAWEGIDKDGQNVLIGFNKAINELSRLPYEWSLPTATKKQQKQYSEARDNYAVYKRFLVNDESFKRAHADSEALLELVQIENKLRLQQFLNTNPEVEKELGRIGSDKIWRSALISTVQERGGYFAAGFIARTAAIGAWGVIGAPVVAAVMGGWLGRKRAQAGLEEKDVETRRGLAQSTNDKKASELLTKIRSLDSSIYRQGEVTEVGNIKDNLQQQNEIISKIIFLNKKQQSDKLSDNEKIDLAKLKGELTRSLETNKDFTIRDGKVYKYIMPFGVRKELEQERDKLETERAKLLSADKNFVKAEGLTAKLDKLIIEFNEIDDFFSDDDPEIQQKIQKVLDSLRARLEYTKDKLDKGLVNFGEAGERLINQQELIDVLNFGETLAGGFASENEITKRLEKFLSYREGKIYKARDRYVTKKMLWGAFYGAAFASAGAVVRDWLFHQDISADVASINQTVAEGDAAMVDSTASELTDEPLKDLSLPADTSVAHNAVALPDTNQVDLELPSTDTTNLELPSIDQADLELPPDLPAGSRITEVIDSSVVTEKDPIEPSVDAITPTVPLTHKFHMLADLEKIPAFKDHLPADQDYMAGGTVSAKGSVSEALDKAMAPDAKVTVITIGGSEIKDFDANLVHEGDTVIETKSGEIIVYKTSEVKVEAGESLTGRYDQISKEFKLNEIPEEVKNEFNLDKAEGGLHEQLNYNEAKAAREYWDAHEELHGASKAKLDEALSIRTAGGVIVTPEVDPVTPAEHINPPSTETGLIGPWDGLDVKLPNGDTLHLIDADSDNIPDHLEIRDESNLAYQTIEFDEKLSHDKAIELVSQARTTSDNLNQLATHLTGDRLEAAKFYKVYGQGSNTTQLFETKPDFALVDNFVGKLGKENLDLLKLENVYSLAKFDIATKMMDRGWAMGEIKEILEAAKDQQQLRLTSEAFLKVNDASYLSVKEALALTERLSLSYKHELWLGILAMKQHETFSKDEATMFARDLFANNDFSASDIKFFDGTNQITFVGLSFKGSAPHDVLFHTIQNKLFIPDIQKDGFELTDFQIANVGYDLKHMPEELSTIIISPETPLTASSLSSKVSQFMTERGYVLKDGNIIEAGGKQYVIDGTVNNIEFLAEGNNLKITVDNIGDGQPEQVFYLKPDGLDHGDIKGFPLIKEVPSDVKASPELPVQNTVNPPVEKVVDASSIEAQNKLIVEAVQAQANKVGELVNKADELVYQDSNDDGVADMVGVAVKGNKPYYTIALPKEFEQPELAELAGGISRASQNLNRMTEALFKDYHIQAERAQVAEFMPIANSLNYEFGTKINEGLARAFEATSYTKNLSFEKDVVIAGLAQYRDGLSSMSDDQMAKATELLFGESFESEKSWYGKNFDVKEVYFTRGLSSELVFKVKKWVSWERGMILDKNNFNNFVIKLNLKQNNFSILDQNGQEVHIGTLTNQELENIPYYLRGEKPPIQEIIANPANAPVTGSTSVNEAEVAPTSGADPKLAAQAPLQELKPNDVNNEVAGIQISNEGRDFVFTSHNPDLPGSSKVTFRYGNRGSGVIGVEILHQRTGNITGDEILKEGYRSILAGKSDKLIGSITDAREQGKDLMQDIDVYQSLIKGGYKAQAEAVKAEILKELNSLEKKFGHEVFNRAKIESIMAGGPISAILPESYKIANSLMDEVGKPYSVGKDGFDCMTLVRQAAKENKGEYPVLDDYNRFLSVHAGKPEELKFSVFLREQQLKYNNASWQTVKENLEPGEYLINMESGGAATYGPEGHGAILTVTPDKQFIMFHASTASLMPEGGQEPVPLHQLTLEIEGHKYQGRQIVEEFKAAYKNHITDRQSDGSKLYDKWLAQNVKFFDSQGNQVQPKLETDGSLRLGYVTKEIDLDSYFKYNQDFAKNIDVLPLNKETSTLALAA